MDPLSDARRFIEHIHQDDEKVVGLQQAKEDVCKAKSKLDHLPKEVFRFAALWVNPAELLWTTRNHVKPISRAYFKLWELLQRFGPTARKNHFHTLHLCEAPGSFIQCTQEWLRLKHPQAQWNWQAVTLKDGLEWKVNHQPHNLIYADLIKQDKLPPNCFHADLVTGDGGVELDVAKLNNQELELFPLLEAQVKHAIRCCARGGSIMIKMFDLFEKETRDLIKNVVGPEFQEVHIVKPWASRICNSERYLIACGKGLGSTNVTEDMLIEWATFHVPHQIAALERATYMIERNNMGYGLRHLQSSATHQWYAKKVQEFYEM